jgi:hypothetical protein
VKLRCRHCNRLIGEAGYHGGMAFLVTPDTPEGSFHARDIGRPEPDGRRRAARWWNQTEGLRHDRRPYPPRYGWDCGGRHRDRIGRITSDRLTSLYEAAARRGEDTIWLP